MSGRRAFESVTDRDESVGKAIETDKGPKMPPPHVLVADWTT